jgi:formylglycine-generating enzyme required for sulfatase activity
MVWVPPGVFAMGDNVYQEEGPLTPTAVQGFWMDRTEVSNGEFAQFVAATGYVTVAERKVDLLAHPGLPAQLQQPGAVVFVMPTDLQHGGDVRQWWKYRPGANWRHPGGPDTSIEGREAMPVVAVTLADAMAYAHWKGRTLPGEAEWEWAARGGNKDTPGKTEQPRQANTWQGVFPVHNSGEDGFAGLAPVGCFAPNGYGLFDMIGNVWELTTDVYRPFHDARDNIPPDQPPPPARANSGEGNGQHVIKGGSYLCAPNYCIRYRPGARQGQDDDLAASHLGFRTILRAPGP